MTPQQYLKDRGLPLDKWVVVHNGKEIDIILLFKEYSDIVNRKAIFNATRLSNMLAKRALNKGK